MEIAKRTKSSMNSLFRLVKIELIQTIGISTMLTGSQQKNFTIISGLWKQFNAEIHKIKNRGLTKDNWEKFGITYTQHHEYFYAATIQYTPDMIPPKSMIRKDIVQGQYACFVHTGSLNKLKSTIYNIYKNILPENDLIPDKTKLIYFEKYDNRFHWNKPGSVIEIFVPIKTGISSSLS